MTERDFQQIVTDLCDWLRLPWYHTHDSRRSNAGFPDLVIVGKSAIIFAELKSATGRVTPAQTEWYRHLFEAGQHVYLWRPEDIYDIKSILEKLAKGTL
jgi:hypothetical protein